jgi:hypothetical protein
MRRFFQIFWAILAAIILAPVLGNYFIELARERGFYESPTRHCSGHRATLSIGNDLTGGYALPMFPAAS